MPTIDPRVVADLKRKHLLTEGHWAFRHGKHGGGLIDRDHLLSDPVVASHVAYVIAKTFFVNQVETVIAASICGAGLAQLVAGFLDPKAKVVFATRDDDGVALAAAIDDLVRGKRLLLVDSIIDTGETISRLAALTEERGGDILGIATVLNLADPEIAGQPVFALLNAHVAVSAASACPLCASGSAAEPAPY